MLYKKKKNKLTSRMANEPYIGVIETTMMYQSNNDRKEQLISVFTLFVEEPSRHLILVRFYDDFIEFDKRIKCHLKKYKLLPLPKLQKEILDDTLSMKKFFKKKKSIFSSTNSDNLEKYLRYCINNSTINSCSLFKEFLQPQRDEDNIIPKNMIHSILQQQQSSILFHNDLIGASGPTPPPDDQIKAYPSSSNSSSFSNQHVSIQDFQLIKVIGRGCMGKVLLVRHKKTSKLLALKAISKKAVIEQSQIVHIKSEQQILADVSSIHHPFLIKLHYSFQDMNQLFLVLDYHVGGDLATQLRINQSLPPDRCRFYTAEIILGIQELHRLGILYRDLKPENILLTADGHLVLTDFGLSKQFYDGLSFEDQRTETFCGTAEYLAPEILNEQAYSYEVDYWSMGTILYEMLMGITPFWAENRDEMYRRIREDRLYFPGNIDVYTADFIAQLLRRDPKKRLGYGKDGAINVRSHPYFEVIDWNLIYSKRIRPPYIPKLYSETDFSHFDSEFLRLTPRLSPVESDYRFSQSLDQAFEGYSYINQEESVLDSSPSEIYSLNEPPTPITLLDTRLNDDTDENDLRYFVYNESDDVIPYDDYAESSSDDIRSADLARNTSGDLFHRYHQQEMDYPPRPARPVTRTVSLTPSNNFSIHSSSTH